MKPRERVLAAINHKEPDRVPIDLGSTIVTGIMAVPYRQLKLRWGLDGVVKVHDWKQQLALVEEPVLRRIGVDVRPTLPEARKWDMITSWKEGRLTDGSPCLIPDWFNPESLPDGSKVVRDETGRVISRMPPDGFYFDDVYHPLQDAETVGDIERYEWEYELSEDLLSALKRRVDELEKDGYAIVEAGFFGSVYEAAQALRGWDTFMMDLAADKRFAGYLMDKLVEMHIERFRQYIEAVGDRVDVVVLGDDLGMETGPQISPELYREMVKPRQAKLYRYIKDHCSAKLFLHSCGSVYKLIPDFIEIGVDILNPVQVAAKDMDSARLKREFGRDLVFWGGGCDTQHVLQFGTPDQVREEVKRRIEDFAPGGGYVFNQVHNIQIGVPPENIEAMFEAALEFGS
jgi:uroporphyrinogen decarboxylase